MSGDLAIPGKVTETSLLLPAKISFEEWQQVGDTLQRCERAVMWWLGDWWLHGDRAYGEAAAQATPTGYSVETLRVAAWVCERIPSIERSKNVPFSFHQQVAGLESVIRITLLQQAIDNEWTQSELRRAVRALRPKGSPAAPEGQFSVILADPPWRYDFSPTDSRQIENQYQTMDVAEICELGKTMPFADNAVLFLWATAPKLREALEVISAWGFSYVTHGVWDKEIIGMGYWFRGQHEPLLVATRGEFPPPPEAVRVSSVIRSRRATHSEKPEAVYELIEAAYPDQPKLEMFARSRRPAWQSWGNEAIAA